MQGWPLAAARCQQQGSCGSQPARQLSRHAKPLCGMRAVRQGSSCPMVWHPSTSLAPRPALASPISSSRCRASSTACLSAGEMRSPPSAARARWVARRRVPPLLVRCRRKRPQATSAGFTRCPVHPTCCIRSCSAHHAHQCPRSCSAQSRPARHRSACLRAAPAQPARRCEALGALPAAGMAAAALTLAVGAAVARRSQARRDAAAPSRCVRQLATSRPVCAISSRNALQQNQGRTGSPHLISERPAWELGKVDE